MDIHASSAVVVVHPGITVDPIGKDSPPSPRLIKVLSVFSKLPSVSALTTCAEPVIPKPISSTPPQGEFP